MKAFSQNDGVVDSILQVVERDISDKERVDAYLVLLTKDRSNLNKSEHYAAKTIELAKKINYPEGEIEAINKLAWAYVSKGIYKKSNHYFKLLVKTSKAKNYPLGLFKAYYGLTWVERLKGNYKTAFGYSKKAEQIAEKLDDNAVLIKAYNLRGIVCFKMGDSKNAIDYYFKSLNSAETLKDKEGMCMALNNIGLVYNSIGEESEALEYHHQALKIAKEENLLQTISVDLMNIGMILDKQKKYTEALKYYNEAIDLELKTGNGRNLIILYNNLAGIYSETNKEGKALEYYDKAIKIGEALNVKDDLVITFTEAGEIYLQQNRFSEAEAYIRKGYKYAQETNGLSNIKVASNALAKLEKELGNYKKAYEAHVLYKKVSDSLTNENVANRITRLSAEYEFKQEKDSIQFANNEQRFALEQEIKRKKVQQNLTLIGVVLLAFFLIVLYVLYTSKRKANLKIEAQKKALEQTDAAKNKLFSIIGHDIRGPMFTFLGVFSLLREELNENKKGRRLKILELSDQLNVAGEQILELLENLLQWARSEQGLVLGNPEVINIQECVKKATQSSSAILSEKELQLTTTIPDDMKVFADNNNLEFIIRNLVNNAIKFTPNNGKINISAAKKEAHVEIKISDTGVGIPKEKLESIFEIETNKSTRGTLGENGSGLGLFMVKSFVTQNHGKIRAESELNKGSTFTIALPYKEECV